MTLQIPALSLVVLMGPSGSGKSTFARKHFAATEVLSSDSCRALVSDDENQLDATDDAFDVLHYVAGKRLARGRLTVVDATNVQVESRKPLIELARRHHALAVAIVLQVPERICRERNAQRPDRQLGAHVVRRQCAQLRRGLRDLGHEGFHHVYRLDPEQIETATIERRPLYCDRREEQGPFDLIGDVHGCCDELEELLAQLGYLREDSAAASETPAAFRHPEGRRVVFLGDLVDRGPRTLDCLRLVIAMVEAGSALCLPGNHDMKLLRKLRGREVQLTHGLAQTVAELDALPIEEGRQLRERLEEFLRGLVSHYVLDGGRLVAAHAGMKQELQGRASRAVRDFALYGETTGETDEFGLPVRVNWAADYRGEACVVYGHTPVPRAEWMNRTINLDTGCAYGGALTALRWPERELVSVPAQREYYEPARPFLPAEDAAPSVAQYAADDVLDIDDVMGKRQVQTRLQGRVTVRAENATAALEVMSRFAVDPRWLIYLPPTMSPCETSRRPELLEHPDEAFAYYRSEGIPRVICQAKHMGSRAIMIVCRDEETAHRRFGVPLNPGSETPHSGGMCYTRTGRRFFDQDEVEAALVTRVAEAMSVSGLWGELNTDWVCLDCELMPWSAKAQGLLREQYAPVAEAMSMSFPKALEYLEVAAGRLPDVRPLLERYRARAATASPYTQSLVNYCWPVESIDDYRLAPFHLLATEGKVHVDRDHCWHMETLKRLCEADTGGEARSVLLATPYRLVEVTEESSCDAAVAWWEELTAAGGEGMVVKPYEFIARGSRRAVQPALKVRGREYLRIIYGPEYTLADNLERLRSRGLGAKRSLAMREFALGIEALERFVRRESLRRVHECVFAVLALESEPVDPRL